MNPRNSIWFRLAALARLAPADTRAEAAPHGFSARVAALAFVAVEPSLSAVLARFSWRALTVAALVMVASIATGYKPLVSSFSQDRDATAALSDPVGEWLNLS